MNILLVSECDKRALTETRRILDQFAERRGERTWQTPITRDGLDTLRKLLRKTARKNTAVACHWIRGRDHSELLWIVGNAGRFNAEGAVPTNTTTRNVLRSEDENDWHTAQDIRLLAQLGALLHDLGKASVAFQERLRGDRRERNLYRHEWVSLRLFLAFVGDDNDEGWLKRLASGEGNLEADWVAERRYLRDGVDAGIERYPFRELTSRAPLAAAVAWLIVSHHRLPVKPAFYDDGQQAWLGKKAKGFQRAWVETPLAEVAHDWNEIAPHCSPNEAKPYWQLAGELPVVHSAWQSQARRVAKALLELQARRGSDWLGNPYVMHLARLSLMLADHHYSSLKVDGNDDPVIERKRFVQPNQTIFANTRKDKRGNTQRNQSLLEHLIGVGYNASLVAHALPNFERHLPRLAHHRGLRKRSSNPRFAWQDKAFDAATSLREAAAEHGAFIVNMASTGTGKTLANARILYALAKPEIGLRMSYALGLRTLTLQTGRSYRRDLGLGDDELAVLVGGSANRALFEYYETQAEASGSASVQDLLEEDSHVVFEGAEADHPLLSRAHADADIRRLLSAPVLTCTVDHLAPATESLRAGRQIAPMLRLMSSDLVLDEVDDYDLDDLPALTRLVHWAGLLGSRVLLSSATLPPALVEGLFMAYRAGRRHYRANRGAVHVAADAALGVPCLWVDEFGKPQAETCHDDEGFSAAHARFVERRVGKLKQADPLRIAELLPVPIAARQPEARIHAAFAGLLRAACLRLHDAHAGIDPVSGKRVSFGIARMANIHPIVEVARALVAGDMPADTRLHLCVYHSRFPLLQRSAIEAMLDTTFNRRDADGVWKLPEIRAAIDDHPEQNHLFVVLASPVCEVGRDWDADWAVAEPSSMRSLIQLAGRVQRHRCQPPQSPNVLVFDTNLKGIQQGNGREAVFIKPGFEKASATDNRFLLASHSLNVLLSEDEYRHLSAVPRIQPRASLEPRKRWVDLEHARLRAELLPDATATASSGSTRKPRLQATACWQHPQAMLTGLLAQQQPFREDNLETTTLVWLPGEEDEDTLKAHRVEELRNGKRGQKLYLSASDRLRDGSVEPAAGISRWGDFDLMELLQDQAEAQELSLRQAAEKFTTVEVRESGQGWHWYPWFGCVNRQ